MHVGSSETAEVLKNPEKETGFILNRSEHWFSLRRLGKYWFDVNSTYEKPKFVSDSYLGMLLMQMKNDGYSVFVVRGSFPQTSIERDSRKLEELVRECSDVQLSGAVAAQKKATPSAFSGSGYSLKEDNTAEIQAAFASAGVNPQEDPELAAGAWSLNHPRYDFVARSHCREPEVSSSTSFGPHGYAFLIDGVVLIHHGAGGDASQKTAAFWRSVIKFGCRFFFRALHVVVIAIQSAKQKFLISPQGQPYSQLSPCHTGLVSFIQTTTMKLDTYYAKNQIYDREGARQRFRNGN
eukprot:766356-Hanusia_phi.AAC.7